MLLKKLSSKKKKIIINIAFIALFFFSMLLWQSTKWVLKVFGYHVTIESILFTLTFPIQGFNIEILAKYPKRFLIAFLPTILYGYLLFKSYQIKQKIFYKSLIGLSFIVFIFSSYYVNKHLDLIDYFKNKRLSTNMYEEKYEKIEPQDVKFTVKNNVIIILMESMEETFNDEALFTENLIPNLTKLRDKNLSFQGYEQLTGTTWTLAALTSYLFGLPLMLPNMHNTFGTVSSSFLPSAPSILSIFEQHGYTIEFFLGSDSNFSGKKNLLFTIFFISNKKTKLLKKKVGASQITSSLKK